MASSRPPDRSNRPESGASARIGKRLPYLLPLIIGGLGVLFWPRAGVPRSSAEEGTSLPGATRTAPRAGPVSGPDAFPDQAPGKGPPPGTVARPEGGSPEQARQRELELWTHRLERARDTLDKYLAATKYPPDSRPISEHPDQVRPNDPIARKHPLKRPGADPASPADTQLKLSQEKVFVVGDETVRFSVAAETASGLPLPLRITSAMAAQPLDDSLPAPTVNPVPLDFSDDGQGGFTATFQPAKQGFGQYHGPIHIEVLLSVGDEEGRAAFDIMFTPAPPAVFSGRVRDVLEEGSLSLYLGASVQKAGRYVVSARVDDAAGKPFALATFNDELAVGQKEIRLIVFGKLIRDQQPAFPLKLRDVDGFLLKEDAYPDRELMNRLTGYVYTTKEYPATAFSDAEWQSEVRNRYVTELTRDVKQAQQEVDARKQ